MTCSLRVVSGCFAVLMVLIIGPVLAFPQHNLCDGTNPVTYCKNVNMTAYCKEFSSKKYGKIVGVCWQEKGGLVGRHSRQLGRSCYCYIIKDADGKAFILPVKRVIPQ